MAEAKPNEDGGSTQVIERRLPQDDLHQVVELKLQAGGNRLTLIIEPATYLFSM